ncbi:MAG: RraA family protein [Bryobacteraceae bacterium]
MPNLSREQLEKLRQFDTCTLSNAIERLDIRPRNEGFIRNTAACRFPQLPPVIGYAVTAKVRASMAPIRGRCYYEHADWWRYASRVPGPRIFAMQDDDDPPGAGALFGEAYARIGRALDCVACVTNGAVRDLPAIEALGFQLFAGSVSVSHAYAHVVEFGVPVEIGGLKIRSGDLLHGDLHGIHSIPLDAAADLDVVAEQVIECDRALAAFTGREDFSVDLLAKMLEEGEHKHLCE